MYECVVENMTDTLNASSSKDQNHIENGVNHECQKEIELVVWLVTPYFSGLLHLHTTIYFSLVHIWF